MNLREYLKRLNDVVEANPKALLLNVVYSHDDEGNGFQAVNYSPTIGRFEDGEFEGDNDIENGNAICIN